MELKKKITSYLKKAILAQVDRCIDFKNDEFYKISQENFYNGEIDPNITIKLFKNNKRESKEESSQDERDKIDESLYVTLAVKVIRTIIEGSQKKDDEQEELTGIYFIPALLNKESSSLLPPIEYNKLPWFPREYLEPMIEPELAIGNNFEYEQTMSDELYNMYSITNWNEYVDFCTKIYEKTTSCKFEEDYVYNLNSKQEKIFLEKNIYIFPDKTANPTYSIRSLYEDILSQEKEIPLYENFINLQTKDDCLIERNTIENKKLHLGQMSGKYGLSASQRESINNFNHQENGEILAIKGPPGTGKTTLIQSIVANEYVKRALREDEPPLIVASSTNNQAVTNIIESFGKIKKQFDKSNIESRWLENINSFATYFPSKTKRKQAKEKGFQYTDNKGNFFVAEMEKQENIEKSRKKFINESQKMFNNETKDISNFKYKIHKMLKDFNNYQNQLIDIVDEFSALKIIDVDEFLAEQNSLIEHLEQNKKNIRNTVEFLNTKYADIPVLWKLLSFSNGYKTKISNRLKIYIEDEELSKYKFLNMKDIEEYYAKEIKQLNIKLTEIKQNIDNIRTKKDTYMQILNELNESNLLNKDEKMKIITNKEELDSWLDTHIRYIEFWLSVHYYEARWLEEENILTEKQKGTNFENVVKMYYERLSLITPCLVMTFYMLPKQFETWDGVKKSYMYNLIDLLIVDEAGQVSTEIAACSFALAKKALVVGDENQIEPVWGIERPLDISLAIQENVIKDKNEFDQLEKYGITASNSNVMKVSCKSTKYSKYGEKGLFLSEHRRCYDDIINYCNDLVYKGKLNPLRGNEGKTLFPKIGYQKIESINSQKVGTSRCNTYEAMEIAKWVKNNYEEIYKYYSDIEPNNVLGIVTPFKAQAATIRNALKVVLPEEIKQRITVGTIHVFQGGERKVIIMSTTYGKDEGCFFIDNNKSLMNVAVSRAEDSFLVFGNIECLKDEETTPSGLLKRYLLKNNT